jgi:hypothetical protein
MPKFTVRVLCIVSKEIDVEIEAATENAAIQEADDLYKDSERSKQLLARLIENGTMETIASEIVLS